MADSGRNSSNFKALVFWKLVLAHARLKLRIFVPTKRILNYSGLALSVGTDYSTCIWKFKKIMSKEADESVWPNFKRVCCSGDPGWNLTTVIWFIIVFYFICLLVLCIHVFYVAPSMKNSHQYHSYRDHNRGEARSQATCSRLHLRTWE